MKLTRREFVKLGLAAGASLVLPKFARADNPPSILWIGWDGADYRTVTALLREGRLPNLANLYTVRLDAVGATVTKPGWVEIITGYEYPKTEVFDNNSSGYTYLSCAYKEVPLERILLYRVMQPPMGYWCGCIFSKAKPTGDAPGEPWHQLRTGGLNYYQSARNGDSLCTEKYTIDQTNGFLFGDPPGSGGALDSLTHPGLMFCHYSRPDRTGHDYGMDSQEYLNKIEKLDAALGQAIAIMNQKVPSGQLRVVVCSDHGFDDPGAHDHEDAPHGFISCNLPLANNCVRRDVGYTVSKMAGLDVQTCDPPLRGKDMRKV